MFAHWRRTMADKSVQVWRATYDPLCCGPVAVTANRSRWWQTAGRWHDEEPSAIWSRNKKQPLVGGVATERPCKPEDGAQIYVEKSGWGGRGWGAVGAHSRACFRQEVLESPWISRQNTAAPQLVIFPRISPRLRYKNVLGRSAKNVLLRRCCRLTHCWPKH